MASFVSAPFLRHCASTRRATCRPRTVTACQPQINGVVPVPHLSPEPDSSVDSRSSSSLPPTEQVLRRKQSSVDPTRPETLIHSASLDEYAEKRLSGLVPPFLSNEGEEWADAWTLSVASQKARELKNQYSRVGILIEHNFTDFTAAPGALEEFTNASIEDITRAKARALYEATGLPSMAETHDMSIDAPASGSQINKTLQQGYYTRAVEEEGNAMIERVRPISDETRATRFNSVVVYFDGEMEIVTHGNVAVAIIFSSVRYATIATAAAFDDMYMELTRRLGLSLYTPGEHPHLSAIDSDVESKKFVGATMLRERLMREAQLLQDGILKVSSFLNHMVDVDLMEECGVEMAERLRETMPNKVLTVESTGLIPALPVAKHMGIPLVFARKTKPITISDSFQTTYRSATKGTTNEIVVSCEYLHAGDRVLIIDDFLAGGSTAEALFKLANMAHATVVGVGVLIEKLSSGGRAFLSGYNVPVESLAKVDIVDSETGTPRLVVHEEKPFRSKASSTEIDDGASFIDTDEDDDVYVQTLDDEEIFDDIEDDLVRRQRK